MGSIARRSSAIRSLLTRSNLISLTTGVTPAGRVGLSVVPKG